MSYQPNTYTLLGSALAVDCTVSGDVIISINSATKYYPLQVILTNTQGTLDTAVAKMWTGAGATGSEITGAFNIDTGQPPEYLNFPVLDTNYLGLTHTETKMYLNLSVANSAPLTIDVYIYGLILE